MMGCKMPWWAGSETPPPDKDKTIADLRAENTAQALLIASLKEDCEAGKRLLREQMALTTARTGEALFVAQQLSDTQRKNAELIAALAPLAECYLPPQGYRHLGVTAHFRTEQITAACAALSASKVSNEGDGKD
jgi:hypothetical protein